MSVTCVGAPSGRALVVARNARDEVVQSAPAAGQVKAAKHTKKIWRKDLVLSEQRELGDSSKLPPMVVDGGARFYDCTPGIDAPDVCKCVAVGTAYA